MYNNNDLVKETSNLHNYILQDKIGAGSFAKVYKVIQKQTNKIFAAKISKEKFDESDEKQFLKISREVNTLCKLDHPVILKFILYSPFNFKRKLKPVIITEYASNGTLSQLIKKEKNNPNNHILNDTMKLIIAYGIVSGMNYLSSLRIVHRDLKSDNILLDENYFPKIADFGLSKSCEYQFNSSISLKGTPIFMAPEIFQDNKYSESSDVYAFGFVLFEIMTLSHQYPQTNIYTFYNQYVCTDYRPEFNDFVPEVYKNLIQRCWSKNPEQRPKFYQILNELKNNKDFITSNVDVDKFNQYMNYIDNYKNNYTINKSVIPVNNFNESKEYLAKIIAIEQESIDIIKYYTSNFSHFTYKYFRSLCRRSRNIVKDADSCFSEKQFEVGRNLIEGRYDFPINVEIGLKYLKQSLKNKNKDSLIYYVKMLIKGEFIPRDHRKAQKLIDKWLSDDCGTAFYLLGKLYKKERQFLLASEYFKKSIELNNSDSIYELAELFRKHLFQSNGHEDEYINLYTKAIMEGNLQAMFKYGVLLYEEKGLDEGIELIKKSAEKGNTKAMYYYGTILEKDDKDVNFYDEKKESIKYFKKAADEGNVKSMSKYGIKMLYNANYRKKNYDKLITYIMKASAKSNFESMFEYGQIIFNLQLFKIAADNGYLKAINIYADLIFNSDKNESLKYYKMAADTNDCDSINKYFFMVASGKFGDADTSELERYIKIAADKGHPLSRFYYYAMYEMKKPGFICDPKKHAEMIKIFGEECKDIKALYTYAEILMKGEIFGVNYEEAFKYYEKVVHASILFLVKKQYEGNVLTKKEEAILQIIIKSHRKCGNMYLNGIGVKTNYYKAMKYYRKILKCDSVAMTNYAYIHEKGLGVTVDYAEAIKYYKMAIDKGNSAAMNNYACMHQEGHGVTVDYTEAIKYYKMAIDKGNSAAMNNYAYMYEKGLGVIVDYAEAIKYYKMAIDKGNSAAMVHYADILLNGKSIEKNKEEAIEYYKLAVSKGNLKAMLKYGMILTEENETPKNKETGLYYIKKSADEGNSDAMYEYGRILEEGKLVSSDFEESIKYYKKASEQGQKKAQNALQRMNDKKSE